MMHPLVCLTQFIACFSAYQAEEVHIMRKFLLIQGRGAKRRNDFFTKFKLAVSKKYLLCIY